MDIHYSFIYLFIIILAIIITYFIIYTKKCNVSLNNSKHHTKLPAPMSVSRSLTTIGIILIFVGNMSQISSLRNRIDNLQSQLNNLRNEFSSMEAEYSEWMKQEASILNSFDYESGELNTSDFTVPVSIQVIPKSYDEQTQVTLNIKGKSFTLENRSGIFTTDIIVSIFDEIYECKVNVSDGEKTETELIDNFVIESTAYLPAIHSASFSQPEPKVTYQNSELTFEGNLDLFADVSKISNISFTEITLVTERNGIVLSEHQLMDTLNFDGFTYDACNIVVNETCTLNEQDEYSIYIRAVDTYGLTYRYGDLYSRKGTDITYNDNMRMIYDKNGVRLQ